MELAKYTTIQTRGWKAWVDKYAITDDGLTYFLSLVGRQTAVKAIAAALLTNNSGQSEEIILTDPRHGQVTLTRDYSSKWRNKHLKLSATSYQQIVLNNCTYFNPVGSYYEKHFTMIVPPGADAEETFYRFLDRRVSTPLHASWAPWLWDIHRPERQPPSRYNTVGVHPLRSLGCQAFKCDLLPMWDLKDAISQAIMEGRLPTVEPDA